jgi:hypothetical protein
MRKLLSVAAVVFALACIFLTVIGQFWAFLLLVVVLGPIAFYRSFINKKTRTVGSRAFVPGRDCRACGGWGNVSGEPCPHCGGRKTR